MERTTEESLRLLKERDNPKRRRLLSGVGKLIHPVIFGAAAAQVNKEYERVVIGHENIPLDRPSIIVASHQTHQDGINYILATGGPINSLAAIDGDSTKAEWSLLEMMGITPVLRGDSELARGSQKAAYEEMIQKTEKIPRTKGLMPRHFVCPEATYCLAFNDMLDLHMGSAVGVANETKEVGTSIIPATAVYVPKDDKGGIEISCVEFGRPFELMKYSDFMTAANALREIILGMKIDLNEKYNPGMKPEEWAMFIAAQAKKYPNDLDYYGNIEYTINYRKAKTEEERKAVQKRFKPQLQQAV